MLRIPGSPPASRQGLAGTDGLTWQSYSGDVLPNPGVLALAPSSDGTLWIGTMGGLAQHRPETTPPWVRIDALNLAPLPGGEVRLNDETAYYMRKGQPVIVAHAPSSGRVRLLEVSEQDSTRFIGVGEVLDDGRVAPRRLVVNS